jgi:hypothetical protein
MFAPIFQHGHVEVDKFIVEPLSFLQTAYALHSYNFTVFLV